MRKQRALVLAVETLEIRRLLATIVVTGTGDTVATDGVVTLREAITSANTDTDVNADVTSQRSGTYLAFGADEVGFNIAGSGVQTITPTIALPIISEPLIINGATQPGYINAPLIQLS